MCQWRSGEKINHKSWRQGTSHGTKHELKLALKCRREQYKFFSFFYCQSFSKLRFAGEEKKQKKGLWREKSRDQSYKRFLKCKQQLWDICGLSWLQIILLVLENNVCREIGQVFLNINITWRHLGGRLAGPKWCHLGGS